MLNPYVVIAKKRDGGDLSESELQFFIDGLISGDVSESQMAALLMAIYIRGMNKTETADLTKIMLHSGEVIVNDDPSQVDKHSTGGVGDKTSFILAPIAAACGVRVPMISGRGLGHTGGTVDKSESIKGFKVEMPSTQFKQQLQDLGVVMIGQTKNIAPADKIIYKLRDTTATIESIPLITASIMSKKLAEGANSFVMDVKTGQGAFLSKKEDAQKLAQSLRETAISFGKNISTLITDMSQPLGHMVGNSLEMIECIETLKGKGPKDLTDLSVRLAAEMIFLGKKAKNQEQALKMAQEALDSGAALKKFQEMIIAQDGDGDVIENYQLFPTTEKQTEVLAIENGYISYMDNKEIGLSCVALGGGRLKPGEPIDYAVGFEIPVKIGDFVKKGDRLLIIHHHEKQKELVAQLSADFQSKLIKIQQDKPEKLPVLIQEIETVWA